MALRIVLRSMNARGGCYYDADTVCVVEDVTGCAGAFVGLPADLPCSGALIFVGDRHGAGRVRAEWAAETEQRNEADREATRANREVAAKTEILYRDRIEKIYVKGDEIAKQIPIYITEIDSSRFTVNAGFVRLYDAAWSREPLGPAAESDREPAGISLAQVTAVEAGNAASCRA